MYLSRPAHSSGRRLHFSFGSQTTFSGYPGSTAAGSRFLTPEMCWTTSLREATPSMTEPVTTRWWRCSGLLWSIWSKFISLIKLRAQTVVMLLTGFCLLLSQMVGVEYILLHAQEPILYIIRKQQRQSPTQGEQCYIWLNFQNSIGAYWAVGVQRTCILLFNKE